MPWQVPHPARSTDGWSEGFRDVARCIADGRNSTADNWCGLFGAADESLARRADHAYAALRCAMRVLCCAMLSYAVLCCAVLCYAMLCYAMLCYAMLWRASSH